MQPKAIGVLTSGGDSQGMNAALRAVVRTAINRGVTVYAIYEGYQGMIEGGERIRVLGWDDVGGIMQQGGTVIGTARSTAFRDREGRLQAAQNLVERGIDRLVVIGGDGSLTGANLFRLEWSSLLEELVANGRLTSKQVQGHSFLGIVGLVGSIDNDFVGTDMTIGADTALHRITEAIDALISTAASHQRTFVVEVMGRRCGYLALMGAISGGADYVIIPENPPEEGWEQRMCDLLCDGRRAGRRDSIVVIAEGAQDRQGNPIKSEYVRKVLEERLGEDTRVTILGHVQRGGAPSAFDRWMSTLLGYTAVEELLSVTPESEPQMIGMRYNRIKRVPLMQCVEETRAVAQAIKNRDYGRAMEMRGGSFTEMYPTFQALAEALPSVQHPVRPGRIGVVLAGSLAPGMNTALRAAVRLGLDQGHEIVGISNGFVGLIKGQVEELSWGKVDGWGSRGGAEIGTSRKTLLDEDLPAVAQTLETNRIDALLSIGGWDGYFSTHLMQQQRSLYPVFNMPTICIPASIDNNLPGSELSLGADTALNSIIESIDKIKQSAVAVQRCFVVEVMGRYCGYLALMSGLASGAERVYIHEEGITLKSLQEELERMIANFRNGQRLSLIIRNEYANKFYTTGFLCSLFEEEGQQLFDVRQTILGHIQQGGNPSPYDRIQATRFAVRSIRFLTEQLAANTTKCAFIGFKEGRLKIFNLDEMLPMSNVLYRRPVEQWWLHLRPIADLLAHERVS